MAGTVLQEYNRKRDFRNTPEPSGKAAVKRGAGRFVVQKHAARQLHYDLRLEWNGVLRSWAVPMGPSLDPAVKRMAIEVEDHPVSYADFEGTIPKGEYGAGSVLLWDRGRWTPAGDAARGLRDGKLKFRLQGEKLNGGFTLVRMRAGRGRRHSWLLIKEKDEFARSAQEFDVLVERGESAKPEGDSDTNAPLPSLLAPQLATLVKAPPAGEGWIYELKLDGYRLLARIDGEDVRCFTRNGNDWSRRMPGIIQALRACKLPPCWLDGELVLLDEGGAPDFQQLQNAFEEKATGKLRYMVFDLLFVDGTDLRGVSQLARRERLCELLDRSCSAVATVQFSQALDGDPRKLLAAARAAGFEGLVGKRAGATYRSGRSADWIKLKAGLRQEFVIGGYTDPQGSRSGFGSLLLGLYEKDGRLRYAGNVGTGFDEATLGRLHGKLGAIQARTSPFADPPARVGPHRLVPHWVKPKLAAEVSFAGWTAGDKVRQAVFHGLREDKPARQIGIERAAEPPSPRERRAARRLRGLRITHPSRLIDPQSQVTKGDLIAYYAAVAPLMLPHLKDRPVALLRAPSGVSGKAFFQKHADKRALPQLDRLPRSLDPGHDPLLVISTAKGLLSAAQMNAVELHTWNATGRTIEKPDRIVLDLDPGEHVAWKEVVEGAQLVHTLLSELGLAAFVKTSGGKGLHVVLPLRPYHGWDEAKSFSKDLVQHLARVLPQRFVAKSGSRNRVGRIFVDYLRNGRGATTVAAWSARARPGMGISVPLSWQELETLKQPPTWSVADPGGRQEIGNEPWKAYARSRQTLGKAVRQLSGSLRRARAR